MTSKNFEGFTAAAKGLPQSDCKYKVGTKHRNEWRAGWHNYHAGKNATGGFLQYKHGQEERPDPRKAMRARNRAMCEGMRKAA